MVYICWHEYYTFTKKIIDGSPNKQISIRVYGDSMLPSIRSGDVVAVKKVKIYTENDIIVFEYGTEGLLVHRIVKIVGERFFCKGDNAYRVEVIHYNDIIGRVVEIKSWWWKNEFIIVDASI